MATQQSPTLRGTLAFRESAAAQCTDPRSRAHACIMSCREYAMMVLPQWRDAWRCLPSQPPKPLCVKPIVCLASNMGSYGPVWLQCEWCWTWGKCCQWGRLFDVDGIGPICDVCIHLDEPPWRPNNRQRWEQHLLVGKVLPPSVRLPEIARILALCLAANTP